MLDIIAVYFFEKYEKTAISNLNISFVQMGVQVERFRD